VELKELARIDFSDARDAAEKLPGWAAPEDGRCWATGRRSAAVLPRPEVPGGGDLVVLLTVDPFTFPPVLPQQTLRVAVNGELLRVTRLRHRTSLACRVGPELLAARPELELEFEHPDGARPNMISPSTDRRLYSVAFVGLSLLSAAAPRRAAPAPAPRPVLDRASLKPAAELGGAELMSHFASLGDNCEFGMAQRCMGANPMDLLRFTGTWLGGLVRGLRNGFEAIDDIDDVEFDLRQAERGREYVLRQRRYEMEAHTTVWEGEMPPARLFSRELKKLGLLSRLLVEDMTAARRIFVYKRNDISSAEFVAPIVEQLRLRGPNTLLHVVRSDGAHPPGHVERLGEGLLRGYIDRFSGYDNAGVEPSAAWQDICLRSYEMWRCQAVAPSPQLSEVDA
jgi:hypothetical protein